MLEGRQYEFRCPVHGFIVVDGWEREIIAHPAFQRLRRIRQLAWTDYVYPGAMHTRFEHSLGVMHVATRLYDAIWERSKETLRSELGYNDDGLRRDRRLIRLAALLHDVGHGPFSHASEELFPVNVKSNKRYEHDTDYSAAIVRHEMKDVIENHNTNRTNYRITADKVAALLEASATAQTAVFWRELISGQMDADRMDYLLRDSLHAGVQYGRYDLERLIQTVVAIPGSDGQAPRLGVSEGGWHAAESLILARYFMFTQVYFHRTRVAYDHHIFRALLGDLLVFEQSAGKTWYKTDKSDDIPVLSENAGRLVEPLSRHSSVVAGIKPSRQMLLYARADQAQSARDRLQTLE